MGRGEKQATRASAQSAPRSVSLAAGPQLLRTCIFYVPFVQETVGLISREGVADPDLFLLPVRFWSLWHREVR